MKLLFVCLGNICRSPAAAAVMHKLSEDRGLTDRIVCDSAGTSAYHAGEGPDERMQAALRARGYLAQGTSRQVDPTDFDRFDHIFAMDKQNLRDLLKVKPNRAVHAKLSLMGDFADGRQEKEVPDPYYGGPAGFDHVIDILEEACTSFLDENLT